MHKHPVLNISHSVPHAAKALAVGLLCLVSLEGCGTHSTSTTNFPGVTLSTARLSFAQVVVGSHGNEESVTLTNTGTAPLVLSSIALSGPSAAAFTIVSGDCLGSVPAGTSCQETLAYSPKLASPGDLATLSFTDNAGGESGSTQGVTLTGSALAKVDLVANFGDSITCGFYAQPNDGTGLVYSQEGYAGLFDTWLAVPAQNWCRQGDTAADLSRQWAAFHSSPNAAGNQLYTFMVGTDDSYRYGVPQSALDAYAAEVGAALAWLALPGTDKVLGNAVTQSSGAWQADTALGVTSTEAGATLTFPITQAEAGRSLYLVYHVWDLPQGQAGRAEIAVDGEVKATVDESSAANAYLPTENGTDDTFLLQTVPLGAAGPHTITFRSVGANGAAVGLLWAGVPGADYRQSDGAPRVLVGMVPNSPSGNQTYAASVYSQRLKTLLAALGADGMNLIAVPTDTVMDPGSDFTDILHPNNSGHSKLAAVFEKYR